MMQQSTDY